jgi:hypothetical protein
VCGIKRLGYLSKREEAMKQPMMQQCCGENGMPDFEKMKQFMKQCGKKEFDAEQIDMMKQFCGEKEMPDLEKMKAMMEKCGCQIPESEEA